MVERMQFFIDIRTTVENTTKPKNMTWSSVSQFYHFLRGCDIFISFTSESRDV